jgi:hypothetical protein
MTNDRRKGLCTNSKKKLGTSIKSSELGKKATLPLLTVVLGVDPEVKQASTGEDKSIPQKAPYCREA